MTPEKQAQIEAATFNKLLAHLDDHKEVQNIDLMILADFCRNCLAKWYSTAAEELGEEIDYDSARTRIYGEPYSEWKQKHQKPATQEQLSAYEQRSKKS